MSDDLVAFLLARVDEDYEAVRIVIGVNVMAAYRQGEPVPRWVLSPKSNAGIWDTNGQPRVKFAWARERDHIIRHDPARVLAEVAAKRAIVKLHGPVVLRGGPGAKYFDTTTVCGSCEPPQFPEHAFPCRTLHLLAAPYAGHEDYRPEWAPDA